MNIREISKPVTAKALNESLAKKFGQKINLESFSLQQLQDTRNKIRTKLSQIEMHENFDSVQNETYQKTKLFLDVLNAAIKERADVEEKMDPVGQEDDDINNDGKTDSSDEYLRKRRAAIAKNSKKKDESIVREGAEDEAELVMAAKDMVDRVTGWMEDTAEMKTESMLELADAIRDEMGSEKSESFTASIKPALEAMYDAMDATRGTLTQGVQMLTGEGAAPMMGAPDDEIPMEPTVDDGEPLPGSDLEGVDEFGAAEPAAGGEEEAGREKRESKRYTKKQIAERSRRLASTLSKKK